MKKAFFILISLCLAIIQCHTQNNQNSEQTMHQNDGRANRLVNSTSPYLQQHAYNPVDWYPWGQEALERAKKEDKPIIVSIGYSSCHWCHVMERESFENDSIANLMNANFINIKVDREERPDVDQIYMDAVQAMGINGGWPLNVFLTPDQKPFYGGTYFPPQNWAKLLDNVSKAFQEKREEIDQSADGLANAIAASEVKKYGLEGKVVVFEPGDLDKMYRTMAKRFDKQEGGSDRAPKFPMPSKWLFLLRYYYLTQDQDALTQLTLTLDKIANGGIYDQVGGGFARYSTDEKWFAPHFEKMLYDNGQLVSLYSEAYNLTKNDHYKAVVYETVAWLEREMTSNEGGFYSALDADSEGEEGKFYVWKKQELDDLLGKESALFSEYFSVEESGNWEHGNNILHKSIPQAAFIKKHNLKPAEWQEKVQNARDKLLIAREKRVRPGLDDKILTGWNALMLKGLTDAYKAFADEKFLDLALKNAAFLEEKMSDGNHLYRSYKDGKADIAAYLEDYALVISAYTSLYQVTFDEKWINRARELADHTLEHFLDEEEEMFFYTSDEGEKLIARKKEVFDNVIPASNSVMAVNLHFLGIIFDHEPYHQLSEKMLSRMVETIQSDPGYLSNWAILYAYLTTPTAEVVIVGVEAQTLRKSIQSEYHPNKVVMGTTQSSDLPLLKERYALQDKTTVFVCYNKTCKLPVFSAEDAFKQLD